MKAGKKRKVELPKFEEAPTGMCAICRKALHADGDHQISALTCGHTFGYACLINHMAVHRRCPFQCPYKKSNPVSRVYGGTSIDSDCVKKELTRTIDEGNKIENELVHEEIRLAELDKLESRYKSINMALKNCLMKFDPSARHLPNPDNHFTNYMSHVTHVFQRVGRVVFNSKGNAQCKFLANDTAVVTNAWCDRNSNRKKILIVDIEQGAVKKACDYGEVATGSEPIINGVCRMSSKTLLAVGEDGDVGYLDIRDPEGGQLFRANAKDGAPTCCEPFLMSATPEYHVLIGTRSGVTLLYDIRKTAAHLDRKEFGNSPITYLKCCALRNSKFKTGLKRDGVISIDLSNDNEPPRYEASKQLAYSVDSFGDPVIGLLVGTKTKVIHCIPPSSGKPALENLQIHSLFGGSFGAIHIDTEGITGCMSEGYMAIGEASGTCRVWNLHVVDEHAVYSRCTSKLMYPVETEVCVSACFNYNHKLPVACIVSGSEDNGDELFETIEAHHFTFAAASEGKIRVYDSLTGRTLSSIKGVTNVSSMTTNFHDNKLDLLVCSNDSLHVFNYYPEINMQP